MSWTERYDETRVGGSLLVTEDRAWTAYNWGSRPKAEVSWLEADMMVEGWYEYGARADDEGNGWW